MSEETTEWTRLCKRTNDPKLSYIEGWLDSLGIRHRRNGHSFHAPILEVPSADHDRAYTTILLAHDSEYTIFDDRPDDDPMFGQIQGYLDSRA